MVYQLKESHVQLYWSITKHNDEWQITHRWMTFRLGLMISLQVESTIVFRLQLQVEKQKINVGHSYILCQHLNYVLFSKHDNNHCDLLYKHWWCMLLGLRNKSLLRLLKPTKSQWWKYLPSLWKTPIVRFWKLSS